MRILLTVLIFCLLISSGAAKEIHKFSIGADLGVTTLLGGVPPWFTVDKTYGLKIRSNLSDKWGMELGFSYYKVFDDSTADNEFKIGSNVKYRGRVWKGYDLALVFKYRFSPHPNKLGLFAGLGGGFFNWEINDASTDTTLNVLSEVGENVDLAVTEIVLTGLLGLEYRIHKNAMLGFDIEMNYLTGWGQEFVAEVEEDLSDWNFKFGLQLSYLFGQKRVGPIPKPQDWGDIDFFRPVSGVISPILLREARVAVEVGDDSDGDGVPDANDDCPNTPVAVGGIVDIRGCPVDSDCDGFPNYLDNCPYNRLGAKVGADGCPIDSDGDGIYDGLDFCPNSDPELGVDESGCIDLSPLEKTVVLHIKYHSGSFEIDKKNQEILEQLCRTLIKAPGVRIEINGFTDNIGTADANKTLSQKRANRVKDFLVRQGIVTDRITAIGKGERNFIASNSTREGRQKNRRVELIFFK